MTSFRGIGLKSVLGLGLAFAIGFACRAFGIPSPAPPVIVGALLVVAMTTGYLLVDRVMPRPPAHSVNCGGPSGLTVRGNDLRGTRAKSTAAHLLTSRAVVALALIGLCGAYLQGGLQKVYDFPAAINEARHFGLPIPEVTAIATIVTELVASVLILSGYYRWVGAIWLAGFTLLATFVANRFWEIPPPDRFGVENSFFEHLGLVGGFLLVAYLDLRKSSFSSEESRVPSEPAT